VNIRKTVIAGMAIVTPFFCFSSTTPALDQYEAIAKRKAAVVPGLVANPAPRLSSTKLDWDTNLQAGFEAGIKITTQAQLDDELERMRTLYAPFMQDLAPAVQPRKRVELDQFDWRLAGKEEWSAPSSAITGSGSWEEVAVPHYSGPIGKAYSFYRKEIVLDQEMLSEPFLFIHFQGVDYYADLYVNGIKVGSHEGLFDAFEFDIKPFVQPGKNTILLQVGNDGFPIGSTPLYGGKIYNYGPKLAANGGPGWDDPNHGWVNTAVGFGLWQRVWLEARSDVYIHDVFVRPLLDEQKAEVWVELGASSLSDIKNVTASYSLFGQNFKASPVLEKTVDFQIESDEVNLFQFPQPEDAQAENVPVHRFKFIVSMQDAKIWTPEQPWLYQLQVKLSREGRRLDVKKRQFGMRSFVQSSDSVPKGRFYLNGEQVRLRGANMMGNLMQCVMRRDFDQLRDDILLAKFANMNFWRMTQQPCQSEVYDYFDRLGLMAQSDLPNFGSLPASKGAEVVRQAGALHRLVRGHASNIMISYMNEPMRKNWEQPTLSMDEIKEVFEQCDLLIENSNPDQVVKWVDGDYANLSQGYSDHHCYNLWYFRKRGLTFSKLYSGEWSKTRAGWMHGCGEYGAEGLDSVALMKKYFPKEWLGYGEDGSWTNKKIPCQSNRPRFKRWVGEPDTLEEFSRVSREHQRRATRLYVEALRRDPKMNSTAIHLLIDAWPAGWMKTIVDYDRQAKPAYFEFRDAQTPLAVNLRPEAFYGFSGLKMKVGTWICNDTTDVLAGAQLKYQLEMNGEVIKTGRNDANMVSCEPEFQGWVEFKAPEVNKRTNMILRVGLFDSSGKLLHDKSVELEILPSEMRFTEPNLPGGRWQFLIES